MLKRVQVPVAGVTPPLHRNVLLSLLSGGCGDALLGEEPLQWSAAAASAFTSKDENDNFSMLVAHHPFGSERRRRGREPLVVFLTTTPKNAQVHLRK